MSIGSVFEGMIRYSFLGVTLALLPMLFLLVLLQAREKIMDGLSTGVTRMAFQKLFEFSDRLDERYDENKIRGSAVWITPVVWIGITSAVALMFLMIIVTTISG
jgi:hypothetical protein